VIGPRARARLGKALRVLFGLAGAAFLVVAFLQTWDRSGGAVLPSWPRFAGAVLIATAGHAVAFVAWSALLGGARSRRLVTGFYVAQLGKYVPGAIWQAVGQVGYTVRAGVPAGTAAAAFAVAAVTQPAAAGTVGATLAVTGSGLPPPVRVAALGALGLCALLNRRWMTRALALVGRLRPGMTATVPPQADILRSWRWTILTAAASGLAFAVLLGGLDPRTSLPAATAAFCLAWTVGYLALPFPAGIGVREAVLIATLGGTVAVPQLIAASVAVRLVLMVAEVTLIAAGRWLPWAVRASAATPPARPADTAPR